MSEVRINKKNVFHLLNKNTVIILLLFLSILLFSFQYSNSWTIMDEIQHEITSSIAAENTNDVSTEGISNIFTVLKSPQFQIITRLVTAIVTIYIISFVIWLISRLDKVVFKVKHDLKYYHITDALYKSMYILIADFIIQSIYMVAYQEAMTGILSIIYTLFIIILQVTVVASRIQVFKYKLFITTGFVLLIIFASASYFLFVL